MQWDISSRASCPTLNSHYFKSYYAGKVWDQIHSCQKPLESLERYLLFLPRNLSNVIRFILDYINTLNRGSLKYNGDKAKHLQVKDTAQHKMHKLEKQWVFTRCCRQKLSRAAVFRREKMGKNSNPDKSSTIPGTPTSMCELHKDRSFHLLCPLRGRAAVARVAGNPICKYKTDSCLSWRSGTEWIHPHPTLQLWSQDSLSVLRITQRWSICQPIKWSKCQPRYLQHLRAFFTAWSHSTWPCCGGSRALGGSLGKGFCYVVTLDPGTQAVMLQPWHFLPCAPGKQLSPEHLGMWELKFPLNWSHVFSPLH